MEKILKFLVSVFLGLICFISYNKNEKNKNYSLKPPFEWYKSLNFGYPGENGTGYVLSETEKSLKLVEIGKNLNSLNEFTCRKISPYSHVFKFYSLVINIYCGKWGRWRISGDSFAWRMTQNALALGQSQRAGRGKSLREPN